MLHTYIHTYTYRHTCAEAFVAMFFVSMLAMIMSDFLRPVGHATKISTERDGWRTEHPQL